MYTIKHQGNKIGNTQVQTADHILLERWYVHGDAAAFRQITGRYANLVYAAAKRVVKNSSDAEDVAQECFETLALRRDSAPDFLGSWLHTVATNRALKLLQSSQRRQAREKRAVSELPDTTRTQWNDLYEHVDAAIAGLPVEFRDAIVGHFLEGRSKAELARRLGVSRPAIHYRIDKGLEVVRGRLRQCGVTTSATALATAMAAESTSALPAGLTASLGKIAVAGTPAATTTIAPMFATTIAGSIVMKKALIVGAIAIAIAGGIGLAVRQPPASPPGGAVPPVDVREAEQAPSGDEYVTKPEEPPTPGAVLADGSDTPAAFANQTEAGAISNAPQDYANAGLGDLAIMGHVVDTEGAPIQGAFIQIYGEGGSAHARTGDDGSFRLHGLAPGRYSGHAGHGRFSSQTLEALDAGDESLVITLSGLATLSGQVVDARDGAPVSKFTVLLQAGISSKIESGLVRGRYEVEDSRGRFQLDNVPVGESTIIVLALGYAPAFEPLRLESNEPVEGLLVEISQGRTIEGIVVDHAGTPVAGARLFAEVPPPPAQLKTQFSGLGEATRAPIDDLAAGLTGSDGAFSINTFRGDEAVLYAFHSEDGSGQTSLTWPAAGSLRGITVVLEKSTGAVEVTVSIAGEPVEGAAVFATPVGGMGANYGRASTGPDGRAILADLPEGMLGINAAYSGQRQNSRRVTVATLVEAGATTVLHINVPSATAVLEGQISLAGEPPVRGNLILSTTYGEYTETYMVNAGVDGMFSFWEVAAGNANLQVNVQFGDTPRAKTVPLTIVEGEAQWLDIDLAGGGTIQGMVAGIPEAARGNVIALRGEQSIENVSMDLVASLTSLVEGAAPIATDGTFSIAGVSPGHYTLLVLVSETRGQDALDGARFATAGVEVLDGETAISDFDMGE